MKSRDVPDAEKITGYVPNRNTSADFRERRRFPRGDDDKRADIILAILEYIPDDILLAAARDAGI